MNRKEFIDLIIKTKSIDKEIVDASKNLDDFPIAFQIIKKLGDSVHLDSLLNSKNIVELRLAKGDLIRANIISMDDSLLKNESYKFIDNISKVIGERVNKENHNQIKLKKNERFY